MPSSEVIHGDCMQVMQGFAECSFDAVVTDPPYGLEFMGREWDTFKTGDGFRRSRNKADTGRENPFGRASKTSPEYMAGAMFQTWCETWAAECLRILKPGGYLLAFGGTRTYHRLACGIEDAGFEIRDSLHWVYGSGFPKGKACLKPSHEPIILARKPDKCSAPLPGLDACRVDGIKDVPASPRRAAQGETYGDLSKDPGTGSGWDRNTGRWPPNLLLTHLPECNGECVPDCPVTELDTQSGVLTSGAPGVRGKPHQTDAMAGQLGLLGRTEVGYSDTGGASRFFPCFKYQAKAAKKERPAVDGVAAHPTVKPVELMRWLVRLITPPGGIVLDPFAGTGTTGEACEAENFRYVLIERDPDYLKLIDARLSRLGGLW